MGFGRGWSTVGRAWGPILLMNLLGLFIGNGGFGVREVGSGGEKVLRSKLG